MKMISQTVNQRVIQSRITDKWWIPWSNQPRLDPKIDISFSLRKVHNIFYDVFVPFYRQGLILNHPSPQHLQMKSGGLYVMLNPEDWSPPREKLILGELFTRICAYTSRKTIFQKRNKLLLFRKTHCLFTHSSKLLITHAHSKYRYWIILENGLTSCRCLHKIGQGPRVSPVYRNGTCSYRGPSIGFPRSYEFW